DPAEVVPLEIDDHRQLGAVLGARGELGGQLSIFRVRAAARAGPLDRPRDQPVAAGLVEPLRTRATDGQVTPPEERREWSRTARPEAEVQLKGIRRSVGHEPLREVYLEYVARGDVLEHPADGLDVVLARDLGAHRAEHPSSHRPWRPGLFECFPPE